MISNLQILFGEKDIDTVWRALRSCREITVESSMGDKRIRVHTCPAAPVWSVPYLVRLEQWDGTVYSSQYFTSVEEMEVTRWVD